jgi:hypothetical protein
MLVICFLLFLSIINMTMPYEIVYQQLMIYFFKLSPIG